MCLRLEGMTPTADDSSLPLQPEEAVESAVEEFQMQKADLSDVVMTPQGADIASCAPYALPRRQPQHTCLGWA